MLHRWDGVIYPLCFGSLKSLNARCFWYLFDIYLGVASYCCPCAKSDPPRLYSVCTTGLFIMSLRTLKYDVCHLCFSFRLIAGGTSSLIV